MISHNEFFFFFFPSPTTLLLYINCNPDETTAVISRGKDKNDFSKNLPCTKLKAVFLAVLRLITNLHYPNHQPCIIPGVLLAIQSGTSRKEKSR